MKPAWLPSILAEIAEAAGLDAALRLAAARGGMEVYIPARVPDEHWLVAAVGRPAADVIARLYGSEGGARVMVPIGPRSTSAQVRATVDRMIAEGASTTVIAAACGYTTRGVEKRRAKVRRQFAQPQARLL